MIPLPAVCEYCRLWRDMLQPMIILILLCILMGSHQKLPHSHSSLGLLKFSSDTHSRGTLFATRSSTLPRNNRAPLSLCGCWYVLSVEVVREEIQLTLDKNPQNCKNSFCLGLFLTARSRRYDDSTRIVSARSLFRH